MKLVYSSPVMELALSDAWWESLNPARKKRYLDQHPNSKYHGKKTKVKKPALAKVKRKKLNTGSMPVKQRQKLVKSVKKGLKNNKVVEDVVEKLSSPIDTDSMPKGKIKKLAGSIREALTSQDAKKTAKAVAKMLLYVGAVAVVTGGSMALGVPADLSLPILLSSITQKMRDAKDDMKLVNNFREAVRNKAASEHSDEEIEDSLVEPVKKPRARKQEEAK